MLTTDQGETALMDLRRLTIEHEPDTAPDEVPATEPAPEAASLPAGAA